MKKIFFILAFLCQVSASFSQANKKLKNGMYLVDKIVYDSTKIDASDTQKTLIKFNQLFLKNAPEKSVGLLIFNSNFVPLELNEEPKLIDQDEKKKKIELSLSHAASEQLAMFTSHNVMKQATLVIDGEALTVHEIREAITGGKMQITRCSDNACEIIYVKLKDSMQK